MKRNSFFIRLYWTQCIGSRLFSSTINNIFQVSNFMLSVAQTIAICRLPSCWMTSYAASLLLVGAKCWIDPWNLGAHPWVHVLSSGANPKRGSIHGCAPRLNAPQMCELFRWFIASVLYREHQKHSVIKKLQFRGSDRNVLLKISVKDNLFCALTLKVLLVCALAL